MNFCKKCGLEEGYPDLVLNENGVCNYCSFYEKNKSMLTDFYHLEEKFIQIIQRAKMQAQTKGAAYDCLVGFSGGKDSTYVIWKLKNTYHMRILAFTYDNGFQTEYGRQNIKKSLEKLDVDYISFTPSHDKFKSLTYKAAFTYNHFCTVCFAQMHYYSLLLAKEKNIPIIINGRSRGQVLQRALDTEYLEPFQETWGLHQFTHQMLKKAEPKMLEEIEREDARVISDAPEIQMLSYFMYHPYDVETIISELRESLNWKQPEVGQKHPDCSAHDIAEYFHLCQHSYPQSAGEMAVEVREGMRDLKETQKRLSEDVEKYRNINPERMDEFKKEIYGYEYKK